MSLGPITTKLTTLNYPHVAELKKERELSFHQFSQIVYFLEAEFIRLLEEGSERQRLLPIDHTGDVQQYANILEDYLTKEDLGTPVLLRGLAQRIVPAPTPVAASQDPTPPSTPPTTPGAVSAQLVVNSATPTSTSAAASPKSPKSGVPTRDSVVRVQLTTFLIAKAVEFVHQDLIVQREQQEGDDASAPTAVDAAPPVAATTALVPGQLTVQPSVGAVLTEKGTVKLFGSMVPQEFDLAQFASNLASDASEAAAFAQKLTATKKADAAINEQAVLKEIDRLTQTMTLAPHIIAKVASPLNLYCTVPVNSVPSAPGQNKGKGKGGKATAAATAPADVLGATSTSPLFDITVAHEDSMDLWQYIVYVATLYAFVARLSAKAGVQFALPKPIIAIALSIKAISTPGYTPQPNAVAAATDSSAQIANSPSTSAETDADAEADADASPTKKGRQSAKKPSVPPSLAGVTESPTELWILARASHLMVLSTLREFSRRVESEVTAAALALKALEPAAGAEGLPPALMEFFEEVAPESIRAPVPSPPKPNNKKPASPTTAATAPVVAEVATSAAAADVSIIMPSHIFPSANANPNALKAAGKAFMKEQEQRKKDNKRGGRNAKDAGKDDVKGAEAGTKPAAEASEAPAAPTAPAAATEGVNMPVVAAKKADLTVIKQKRLQKESFAQRKQHITDFISGRFHLDRLVALATLSSQDAVRKISTLATLPLGAESTRRQQEQLAAFGQASLDAKNAAPNSLPQTPALAASSESTTVPAAEETAMTDGSDGDKKPDGGKKVVSPAQFISILTAVIHLLYDQQLQQQQNIITRWIQYLQTFTARQSHAGSSTK